MTIKNSYEDDNKKIYRRWKNLLYPGTDSTNMAYYGLQNQESLFNKHASYISSYSTSKEQKEVDRELEEMLKSIS